MTNCKWLDVKLLIRFQHQIKGILWLYENYLLERGCILADDMGLGKTVQISVFLGSLYKKKKLT
jgi:SNF2 family DNA or RNA helicase